MSFEEKYRIKNQFYQLMESLPSPSRTTWKHTVVPLEQLQSQGMFSGAAVGTREGQQRWTKAITGVSGGCIHFS